MVAWLGLALGGCGITAGDAAAVEDEASFLARCQSVDGVDCATAWRRAGHAAPMADALLALAPETGVAAPSRADMRARLAAVQWSSAIDGRLGDLHLRLPEDGSVSFRWQEQGSEGRYDLLEALRLRGVSLRTLGCPKYPGALMGMEKVMTAELAGREPFVLTVYSRPAPTGFEPAVYEVDVDFSGTVPDIAALRAGRYPGGGGRAFAIDPVGFVQDCPDPQ